jgi:cellulose synthase/poly-beta-1,6-N-acetylglucosamine synthase-like glycosyltransferase
MTQIYITSFFRRQFTEETIKKIHERTTPGSFQIHVFDNNSDKETRQFLYGLLDSGSITSLHLDSRNTGCLYNKLVYHAMTESKDRYYVVTDNDVFPPKLDPDWLVRMTRVMDNHPELAFLTPQLPPIEFQMPYKTLEDIVYCRAVGNTFKLVRREFMPFYDIEQRLGLFGDDYQISQVVQQRHYKVAFCRNIFCWHAGQCENWGYKAEEIAMDARKVGYGNPYVYQPVNMDTYEPPQELRV